ncbi:MAG: T9SS type A sorting domain-containing protein [candidate division WOR-3 bacterium]
MKAIKTFFIFFIFLFASETSFISSNNPIEDIYGKAPKSSPFNARLTDDSLWIKTDSMPLPSIGSSDAWTGLKVYGDTVYIVLNQANMAFQVQKRNRLTGALISSFNGNTTPSYAMSAVRVDDSIFVSVFYPSPEHIEVYSANGTYVRSFNAPSGFRCRGMDWDGSKLWACNTQEYGNTIYTMTREGTLLRNLTNTGPITCYWFFDMTLDRMIPNRLWVNDQESPFVTRYISFDTIANTYQVNATFTHPGSPSYYPEGIGFYGPEGGNGYIYTVGHASLWAWKMMVHTYTGTSDVGVAAIRNPSAIVDPNSSITPIAVIKNFGAQSQSNIPVYFWIDSSNVRIYNRDINFPGPLNPGETARVTFPNWFTGPAGINYQITCFTNLGNDTNRTNDTLKQRTTTFLVRDTLIAPFAQVSPNIDGNIQQSEWYDALKWDISDVLNMQGSGPRPAGSVFLYVKHDSNNVYWALDFVAKNTRDNYDQFGCYLDENYSRTWATDSSEGNHWFVWLNQDTVVYRALIGPGNIPSAYWVRWASGNGISRASTVSGHLQFEAVVAKGTQKWNYNINTICDTVGFYVYASAGPTGNDMWGTWPTTMPGSNWNNAATYGTLIFGSQPSAISETQIITFKKSKNNIFRMPLILKDVENISIYDATGKLLRRINKIDKELIWDGKDNKGNFLSYGIYFLKLKTKDGLLTEKIIITR